jgi:hypothetical protein
MNQLDQAGECLERLMAYEKSSPGLQPCFSIAIIYASLGYPEDMFHYLNKSIEARENLVLFLKSYEKFKEYHTDQRFNELLKMIGIPSLDQHRPSL